MRAREDLHPNFAEFPFHALLRCIGVGVEPPKPLQPFQTRSIGYIDAIVLLGRRTHMHWYNPKVGKVEDVRAPSTDEEALEMLSGHPDSDGFVERYVVLREEGMSVEQALVFVGHRFRMFHLRHHNLGRTPELQHLY
jgi:hypothetical protein